MRTAAVLLCSGGAPAAAASLFPVFHRRCQRCCASARSPHASRHACPRLPTPSARRRSGLPGAVWRRRCWTSSSPHRRPRRCVCVCVRESVCRGKCVCAARPPAQRCNAWHPSMGLPQGATWAVCSAAPGCSCRPLSPAAPSCARCRSPQRRPAPPAAAAAVGRAGRVWPPAVAARVCGDGCGAVHAAQGPRQVCALAGALPQGLAG